MDNQTIYALSTVYGKSGVAVIRISGKDALAAVSRLTPLDVSGLKPRYAYFTNIYDSVSRETLEAVQRDLQESGIIYRRRYRRISDSRLPGSHCLAYGKSRSSEKFSSCRTG